MYSPALGDERDALLLYLVLPRCQPFLTPKDSPTGTTGTSPMMALSTVVLPAPLGPIYCHDLASAHAQRDVIEPSTMAP